MKRLICILLTLSSAFLISCEKQDTGYRIKNKETAFYDMAYNVYENGLLYTAPQTSGTQAYFLDYETMNSTPLCNKPNCTHTDSSCISNLCVKTFLVPVIYQDSVYWFASDHKIVDSDDGESQEAELKTKCMKAKLDTGTVETFAEIDGVFMRSAIDLIIDKEKLYIIGCREIYQDPIDGSWGGFSRSGEQYLYSIDLESAEVQNYGQINDSPYAENNWIHGASILSEVRMGGIYNNKLYMYYRYIEDPKIMIDYLETDWVMNGSPQNDIPWIIENKCIDLETGEITVSDLPYAWCIGEKFYVYEENDKFYILDENGEKTLANNMYDNETYDFTVVNSKLWKGSINQGFDIQTGEELNLAEKYCDSGAMIMDFVNDQYIVKYYENGELHFDRISEQNLLSQ